MEEWVLLVFELWIGFVGSILNKVMGPFQLERARGEP